MSTMSEKWLCGFENMDESQVYKKPWADHLLEQSLEITRRAVIRWFFVVCKIGEADLNIDHYVSIFLQQVETMYDDLIVDIDRVHVKCIDKIEKSLEKMQRLCRDLRIDIPNVNAQDYPSLGEVKRVLTQKIDEFEAAVITRKNELEALNKRQMKCCILLKREPLILAESPLPFPDEIENLRANIDLLETETMEREERFFQLREEIVELVNEFSISPCLDFEREILSLPSNEVRIADSDLENLQIYHARVLQSAKDMKDEILQLRRTIEDLWDKLEVDIGVRDHFRQNTCGNTMSVLQVLQEEVRRLEQAKKDNMGAFIEKQRQELSELWDKCRCTRQERDEFKFYNCDLYSEDLFALHDFEIKKWSSYYNKNKKILELLVEHQKLWDDYCALEQSADGANRYKNRGGKLLAEEKRRNKLKKLIPKTEERLFELADKFLSQNSREFLTYGMTIRGHITKLHEDHDQELKLKLSAKKQQREEATIAGHSKMKLFPTPSPAKQQSKKTPISMSSTRRGLFATPMTAPRKKRKSGSTGKISKSGLPKVTVGKKRRSSGRRKKLKLSFSNQETKENRNATAETTYLDFEQDLTERKDWRSTTFNIPDLRDCAAAVTEQHKAPMASHAIKVIVTTPSKTNYFVTPNSASKNRTPLRERQAK